MSVIAMLLALVAFGAFGLATDAHYQRLTGQRLPASSKAPTRVAASLMLTLSAAASVVARGWVFGPVWWLGFVMLAAGVVFLGMNLVKVRIKK